MGWGPPWSHLNWQKISAYSAEMLEACRTVTRKVKMLPSFRWSRAASRGPSIVDFSGLSRRRSSGVTAWRREPSDVRSCLPDACQQLCTAAGRELPEAGACSAQMAPAVSAGGSPLTCAGVVVDFVGGGPQVTDLPLAFDDAQLLLGGSRAGHPHGGAGLGLELQGGDGEACLREAGGAATAVPSTGTATRAAPARPSRPTAAPPGQGSSSSGTRARCHPERALHRPMAGTGQRAARSFKPQGTSMPRRAAALQTMPPCHRRGRTFSKCWSSKDIFAVPDCRTPEP